MNYGGRRGSLGAQHLNANAQCWQGWGEPWIWVETPKILGLDWRRHTRCVMEMALQTCRSQARRGSGTEVWGPCSGTSPGIPVPIQQDLP